jgi:hypothetical protein
VLRIVISEMQVDGRWHTLKIEQKKVVNVEGQRPHKVTKENKRSKNKNKNKLGRQTEVIKEEEAQSSSASEARSSSAFLLLVLNKKA